MAFLDDPGLDRYHRSMMASIGFRQNSTAYAAGKTARSTKLDPSMCLFCVMGGTTAASEPTAIASASEGQTVTDGSVVWKIQAMGKAPTLGIGTVTTGAAGSNAAASITDNGNSSYSLNLTIPKGDTGAAGSNGSAPVVSSTITVSTLAAGSSATASWSGAGTSASPLKLSLGIPRGATGSTGSAGASGISGGSVAQSGYTKFGNGLILQWGKGTNGNITFPIQFSTVFGVVALRNSGTSMYDLLGHDISTTGCTIKTYSGSGYSVITAAPFYIAIGK